MTGCAAQADVFCVRGALVCSLTQMDVLWYAELLAGWEVCAAAFNGLQHGCSVPSASSRLCCSGPLQEGG